MDANAAEFFPATTFEQFLQTGDGEYVRYNIGPQLSYLRSLFPGGTIVGPGIFCTRQSIPFVPGEVLVSCLEGVSDTKGVEIRIDYRNLSLRAALAGLRDSPRDVAPAARALVHRKHCGVSHLEDRLVLERHFPLNDTTWEIGTGWLLDKLVEEFSITNLDRARLLFGNTVFEQLHGRLGNSTRLVDATTFHYEPNLKPVNVVMPCSCSALGGGAPFFWEPLATCHRHASDPFYFLHLFRSTVPSHLLSRCAPANTQRWRLDKRSVHHKDGCLGCALDDCVE